MSLTIRRSQTASGGLLLIIGTECGWDDFPSRAAEIVRHFHMKVINKTDGLDVRMWITSIGSKKFCVSWDTWCPEVTVMPWEDTPDEALEALLRDR